MSGNKEELATQQAYIDRFRASATRSTQAKSREKLLDKVERIEAPIESVSGPRFQFPPAPRSGRLIAEIEDLTHSYGEQILFLGANLEIERGDRIAFVGPNGAGKSTLLRLVMGIETPEEGSAELGEHNVIASYFEQDQAEALDLSKTVIDTMFEAVPDWTQTQVRSLLGSFCFSNDAVFKEVGKLSGGEKARLALALMLLSPCNLLVLDEPTNHLDIPAKEMLENALRDYEGAALVVSHDRYFVSQVANKIVEIRDGELVVYRGDYAYYREKKAEEAAAAEAARQAAEQKQTQGQTRQTKIQGGGPKIRCLTGNWQQRTEARSNKYLTQKLHIALGKKTHSPRGYRQVMHRLSRAIESRPWTPCSTRRHRPFAPATAPLQRARRATR